MNHNPRKLAAGLSQLVVHYKRGLLMALLVAVFGSLLCGRVEAQTFTVLHTFTFDSLLQYGPAGSLILSGNTLYGTTAQGGDWDNGTVFALNTDGSGFRTLYNFTAYTLTSINNDGANPNQALLLLSNTLYGTAYNGGTSDGGTVFKLNTDGSGFTNLHNFDFNDGAWPLSSLVLSGNTLYGTASSSRSNGVVFAMNTDGTGFADRYSFSGYTGLPQNNPTNSDGAGPLSGVILAGNTLYGTTSSGGASGYGAVFKVNTDGTGFANLHSFPAITYNSEGAYPAASLVLSGNTLYGTTQSGGTSDSGTLFAVNNDGSNFRTLYSFGSTQDDGDDPVAGLILSGNTLYGTTYYGGPSKNGNVFAINSDGTGFVTLYSFTAGNSVAVGAVVTNSDGAFPSGGLVLSGNKLYGTTRTGGSSGNGTIFSISFAAQLSIARSGANVVLSWPTNYAGFDYTGYILQSTTNLASPVWTSNLPAPVLVNGQLIITNPISGMQQFFRLSQ